MSENTPESERAKEEASHILDKLGDKVPDDTRAFFEEAVIKVKQDHLQLKDALQFTPFMMEEIYRYGYNFYKAGKYQDALSAFIFLRLLDITDVRYTFGIAACYQYMKDYKNAAANYMLCNYMDPFNPLPCFHLYDCFMKTDHTISALRALEEALILAERNPKYDVLKGKILMELDFLKDFIKNNLAEKYDTAASKAVSK